MDLGGVDPDPTLVKKNAGPSVKKIGSGSGLIDLFQNFFFSIKVYKKKKLTSNF